MLTSLISLIPSIAHLPALAPLIASKEAALVAVYSRSAKTAQTFVDAAKNALSGPPEIPVYSDDSGADRNLDALLKREDVHAVVVVLPIPTQPDVIRKVRRYTMTSDTEG